MCAGVTLRTERLTLRKLTMADMPALVAGLNDLAVSRWLTVVPHPYTDADARGFIGDVAQHPGYAGFGIEAAQGLVGVVGISRSLGYWIARPAQAQGYASEAAAALVGHYFANTQARSLASGYFDGNAASARVLSRLGFAPCGEERVTSRAQGIEVSLKKMILRREVWEARNEL
jgi:RimJ/RimL family protein N-acetyltransferase